MKEMKLKDLFNENESFIISDFKRSGINDKTIARYIKDGYLFEDEEGWMLYYQALYEDNKTDYYNKRLKAPMRGQGKYKKVAGQPSRLFRPLDFSVQKFKNVNEYLVITEGDKKAIKAVQEGFNCVSLSGVWNWKQKPKSYNEDSTETINNEDIELYADIIPDIANAHFENKLIYLCYDNDMWHNPNVKTALYNLAAYLIAEKKAIVKIIDLPKGKEKGLDDYLIAFGASEFQKLMDSARTVCLKDIQNELSGQKKIAKFPIEIFDEPIRDLIIELHKRMDAPLEYIACSFLVAVSTLMDGHYLINANPASNWKVHPILWLAIVGNPAQKKTSCLSIGKEIVSHFQKLLQNYENSIPPEESHKVRLMTQDFTKESLVYLVHNNSSFHQGIGIWVDELAFFLKGLNQFKRGGNDLEYFLSSWSKETQHIFRKKDKTDYEIEASHNIIGSIQPKVLNDTIMIKGGDSYEGMVERWLYCCSEYLETGVLQNTNSEYDISAFIKPCEKIFEAYHPYKINNEPCKTFCFSKEAQQKFQDIWKNIAQIKRSERLIDLEKAYIEKQKTYIARFALILHALKDVSEDEISKETLCNAIKLSKYFLRTFRYTINNRMTHNKLEEYTLNYIKSKEQKTISPTKLHKSNTSKFKKKQDATNVLENLAAKGYGRLAKVSNGCMFVYYG